MPGQKLKGLWLGAGVGRRSEVVRALFDLRQQDFPRLRPHSQEALLGGLGVTDRSDMAEQGHLDAIRLCRLAVRTLAPLAGLTGEERPVVHRLHLVGLAHCLMPMWGVGKQCLEVVCALLDLG